MSSILRAVKNTVYQYTEVEKKVREATNNDRWGVSTSAMSDLARATNNYEEYPELFGMLWKRLNDVDHVLHVQKALILTDYLLRNGSERFLVDVKRRSRDIAQLTKYKHYDEMNRDDAGECRTKAKQVYDLLMDEKKLAEERNKAHAIRDVKLSGYGAGGPNSNGNSYQSERRDYGAQYSSREERPRSRRNSDDRGEEERNERRTNTTTRTQDDSATNSRTNSRPTSGAASARKKAPTEESIAKSGAAPASTTSTSSTTADKPKKKKKPTGTSSSSAAAATNGGKSSSSASVDPFTSSADPFTDSGFGADPFDIPASSSSSSSNDPFGAPAPFAAVSSSSSSSTSAPNSAVVVTRQLSSKPASSTASASNSSSSSSSSSSASHPNLASAVPAVKSRKGRKKESEIQQSAPTQPESTPVFDRKVSYDLSAYSTATPSHHNQNIDILTGNDLGALGSGSTANLETIFAATSFGASNSNSGFAAAFGDANDNEDVFGSSSSNSNSQMNGNGNSNSHSNGSDKHSKSSSSSSSSAPESKSTEDVWAIGSEFTNIDSIDKPAERKKNASKEEVSMAMMRSMQPLGTPATATDGPNANKRSNIAPPQQIANSGMGVGGGLQYAGAGHFNPYAVVPYGQAAPMLALMPPGMTGGVPVLMYPGAVGGAGFPPQAGVGVGGNGFGAGGELPFAAAPSRKQPTSSAGANGKTVIFEAVPEARPVVAVPVVAQTSTKPTGPRW